MEHPSLTPYAGVALTFFSREKKVSKEKRGVAPLRCRGLVVVKNKKKKLAPRRTGA